MNGKCLICLLSLPLISLIPAGAGESVERLHFPAARFSIAPLDTPAGPSTQTVLMMALPVGNNFAANITVQIQPYEGSIEDYMSLSLQQFKDNGIAVHSKKSIGKTTVEFEYSGKLQGQTLHWYARAEKSGSHVYLATATTTEKDWPTQARKLKACVDSLKCE